MKGLGDVARCQAARGQGILVEVGHDHSGFATVRVGNLGPLHDCKIGADNVLPEVVKRRVGKRRAGKAELDDRYVGCSIAQDEWRRDVGRQVFQNKEGATGELGDSPRDIGALMQEDSFNADAVIACRLDPFEVVDFRCQLAFVKRQNPVLDIQRLHTVVGPNHRYNRNVDFGKDVDGHAQRGAYAKQHGQD